MKAQYIEITSGEGSTLRQTKKTQHEISFSNQKFVLVFASQLVFQSNIG
jgi:hypothetical protein